MHFALRLVAPLDGGPLVRHRDGIVRPDEAVKELDALLSEVAGALYAVDSAGDLAFVRTQAEAGNPASKPVIEDLAAAWEVYPLAKEALDRLTQALAGQDQAGVKAGLGPSAVTLPDGTSMALRPLLKGMRKEIDAIAAGVARMAETARQAVMRLDEARVEAQELAVRAEAAGAGAGDDPELAAVRAALEVATAAIAADPTTAPDLSRLDKAMQAARTRVEQLEGARTGLPAELAAAASQLDEIDRLAARGADAREQARAKIAAPAGLLDPLAAERGRPLRPWLQRIREQAESGHWDAAASAFRAWRSEADARLTEARRVADANAAPVARRNELRGLLDAYKAKGQAFGRDEDGRLARLHDAARTALYTAPCDLPAAEQLVREYMGAVNAAATGREA